MQTTEKTDLPGASPLGFPLQAGYGPPPGGGSYGPPGGGGYGPPGGGGYGPPGGGGYGPPPGGPSGPWDPSAPGPGATVLGPPPGATVLGPPPVGYGGGGGGGGGSGGGPAAPPPPPPPKKKGKTGLIVGIAGAVTAIGLGVGAYFLFFRGGDPFPCPVQNLPEDTAAVTHIPIDYAIAAELGVTPGDVPDQARWSQMAEDFCGGTDLFGALMQADQRGEASTENVAKKIAKAIEGKKDTSKYLECGKQVAKASKGQVYSLQFGRKEKAKNLTIFLNSMESRPDSAKKLGKWKVKGALTDAGCFLEDKQEECDEKGSRGIARVENTNMWLKGDLPDLAAFGDDFKERDKVSKDAEKLNELAKKVKRHKTTTVGNYETLRLDFGGAVGAGLRDKLWDPDAKKCEKTPEEKDDPEKLEKQRKKLKEIEPQWAYGSSGTKGEGKVDLYYRTDKEDDAKDLFDLVEKLLKKDKAKIKPTKECEAGEADVAKEEREKAGDEGKKRDLKKSYKAYEKAIKAIRRRALEGAEVTQDGQWVVVSMELKPEDDEKGTIDDYVNEQKDKLEAASKVIDALLNGEKPEKDLFKQLGGSALVEAVEKAKEEGKKEEGKEEKKP